MPINNSIINQKGTPAFFSDIFANRPAFGYAGRVFISTDTGAIYEDTGTSWTLIADAGAGTTGTLQQVTTNGNTTTLGIQVQGIDINDGAGTGTGNTAIGTSSLALTTNGINNTALGNTALSLNTTGSSNTGIGQLSLEKNTQGSNNTAIGNSSLQNNTTAQYNTAIGSLSLQNNTGSNNTGVGLSSLNQNTTGTNNTSLGYNSGSSIITGSNNTIIGSYTGTSTLASNIVLSDGNGNVRLFSNSTGLIGINQAVGTPSAQVDIHTTQTYGLIVNGTTTNNAYLGFSNAGVTQWRVGNNYNAGANSFDIFNLGTSSTPFSINKTTNLITLGSSIVIPNASYYRSLTSTGTSVRMLGINAGDVAYVGAIDSGVLSTIFNASSTSLTASFYTSGTEKVTINSVGSVGIGLSLIHI
jgi:hypothetical protein